MAIKHFRFDPDLAEAFVRFGYEHYRGDANWIPPLESELRGQLSPDFPFYRKPGNHHRHFIATAGKRVVGRISAMVNKDLKDRDQTSVGTLGFFECVEDGEVASDLIGSAVEWLHDERGIERVWGPMNFDIWHNHRFMTRGFDQNLFCGEPYNKPYYPRFFEQCNFKVKQFWDSVEITGRDALQSIIVRGEKRYQLLIDRGYRFELFRMDKFREELQKLHTIISESFSEFLGFTPISLEEFERSFAKRRNALHPGLSVFAYDESDTLAGFATTFLELSEAVRSMRGKDNLIGKLRFIRNRRRANRINFYIGGVTPEEIRKRSGLGRAGFYFVINRMLNEGFETLLLTLRLKGNFAHALVWKDETVPQREYALYELNL
jgi:hypothetical protein